MTEKEFVGEEENFSEEQAYLAHDLYETNQEDYFETPSEEYGFEVENWEDDTYTAPQQIPNTVFDGQSPLTLSEKIGDIPLNAMSGISLGVKSIIDAVTATSYGLTNLAVKGKWETPTAQEMENDATVLPKNLIDYEPKTTTGAITKEVARIGYGTAVTSTGLGAVGLTGKAGILTNATIKGISKSKEGIAVGKILAPLVNGIATDSLIFWQDEGNLSNLLKEKSSNPTIKKLADYLDIEEDDTFVERAAKQALEGVFISTAAHGILNIVKGIKKAAKYKKTINEIKNANVIGEIEGVAEKEIPESVTVAKNESQKLEEKLAGKNEFEKSEIKAQDLENKTGVSALRELPIYQIKRAPNIPVVKQAIQDIKQEAKDMGIKMPFIPRNPEKIDAELIKREVAEKLSDYIDIDNAEDMVKYNQFLKEAKNQVEKVSIALKAENDTVNEGLIKMQALKNNAMKNNQILTNAEKSNAIKDVLDKFSKARGAAEDEAYEGAKALNVTSKDIVHRANKALLENIEKNLDEISTPEVFDVLSSSKTAEELQAKINSLFNIVKEGATKKSITKKLVALEQAGLMSATDTLMRNVYTSLENITLGTLDDVAESMISQIKIFATKSGAKSRDFIDIFKRTGAYGNYLKDFALWMLHKSKQTRSPWRKYRDSVSLKLNTNLPKNVGEMFKDSNLLNAYIRFSGVGISENVDNFFEAGFYRGEVATRVQAQLRRLEKEFKLSKEQLNKIGNTMYSNLTNVDTTARKYEIQEMNEAFFQGIEKAISKKSVLGATEMTFRSGQSAFTKGLTKAIDWIPGLRIFAPFVKTSSTIVFDRFLHDRTPIGGVYEAARWGLSKLLPDQISSQLNNPALRNRFFAKQIVGGGILSLGAYMYGNNMITGDYPSDPKLRKIWMSAGIQPNSLVLTAADGTKRYISLNNIGIFSMLLKYPAKIAEYYKEQDAKLVSRENKIDMDKRIQNDIIATSIAIGESLSEETVLRNVSDFFNRISKGFSDSEDIENFVVNFATNPAKNVIPRVFRQIMSNKDYKEITENNLKSLEDLINGSPIKYDVFGDPMEAPDFGKAMAGIKVQSSTPKEKYKYIMSALDISVPGVNKTEMPFENHSVRLTEEQVNSVYKKMGELGVGDAIAAAVSSINPKNITEGERIVIQEQIKKTYNIYKNAALKLLISEDNDISTGFYNRIDTDIENEYNKTKNVIPSLAL